MQDKVKVGKSDAYSKSLQRFKTIPGILPETIERDDPWLEERNQFGPMIFIET